MIFLLMKNIGFKLLSIPFLYASLVFLLVSIASNPHINLPMLLGKNRDGTFPIWSYIMFSPFLVFVRIFSIFRRILSNEDPYNEICEGVYVGGWPYSHETFPPKNPAIIDCTCEFPRKTGFSSNGYLCVPTWDTRAPQPSELESAVKWACRKKAQGVPVFIHCAYGHGRSVAVMCALLMSLGVVDNWKDAEKLIQKRRPYIRMNSLHRAALEEWAKHRLSPLRRRGETNVSSVIMSNTLGSHSSNWE
ncbi:Uncharacterized protein RDABS01_031456 [Bienertia sinuspersici]